MIIIVGESASGKSTVAQILADRYGYQRVITCTTRPMRAGEKDGLDYKFINEDAFQMLVNMNFFCETSSYNGWRYGTPKTTPTSKSVLITTPKGMRIASETAVDTPIRIYIRVTESERLSRLAARGDSAIECLRRIISDQGMFDGVEEECDYVLEATDMSPDELASAIHDICKMEDGY